MPINMYLGDQNASGQPFLALLERMSRGACGLIRDTC